MSSKGKAPAPPSAAELSQQSLQSQIEGLPQQLAAEREFGPQFAQLALDISGQFAPQAQQQRLDLQREFGPQFAEQTLAEREILAPEAVAGQQAVTSFLGGGAVSGFEEATQSALDQFLSGGEVLTEAQRTNLQEDLRQAQNVRGFGIASPLGSLDEIRQLENLRQNIRGQNLQARLGVAGQQLGAEQQLAGVGLSAAGRLPSQFQQISPSFTAPTPQFTQTLGAGQFAQAGLSSAELANQKFLQDQESRAAFGKTVGALGGGAIGAFFGGPPGAIQGAQIGGSAGGLL